MTKIALLAAALLVASPATNAQSVKTPPADPAHATAKPYVATMTFDVASVRENKKADLNSGITMSTNLVPHTTKVRLVNWRIESLVAYAYGVDESLVSGGPNWPWPTVFVVEAKGDEEADAKIAALTNEQQRSEQQHMMQVLLEERFKLKTHWETKEGDVYNLLVAKGGPKLGAEGSKLPSADELKMLGEHPVPPLRQKNDGQGYDFIAHACPMDQWVETLSSQFGRPVIDKTGLTGKYDFVLKYRGRWDSDRKADDPDATLPLDRALQDELGLRVEKAKGSVKHLVIDHVEKPSEN